MVDGGALGVGATSAGGILLAHIHTAAVDTRLVGGAVSVLNTLQLGTSNPVVKNNF